MKDNIVISYIFRAPTNEKSIERVFAPIIKSLQLKGVSVEYCYAKSSCIWPFAMLCNLVYYAIKSNQNRICHITGDVQYVACLMRPKNTILTIHDCVSLHNPETPKWFKFVLYYLWYKIPIRRLKYITCISEETKRDLISFFPWAENKIVVIPNAEGEEFRFSQNQFNADCPRILHIGTRNNKNLERVIQALEGINCKLIIIGIMSETQRDLLKKHDINYENRYHISDSEIVLEYQKADIISFPSLFEGFGMPVIEGQTVGRPVVTSNIEPMRTIAGPNSILVDPESIESIRNGFLTVINDKEKRDLCVESGLVNSKRFTTSYVVDEYCKIYKKMI